MTIWVYAVAAGVLPILGSQMWNDRGFAALTRSATAGQAKVKVPVAPVPTSRVASVPVSAVAVPTVAFTVPGTESGATGSTPSTIQPAGPGVQPLERTIFFDSNRGGNYEVYAMAADGSNVRQLSSDPASDSWWPRPSPDRSRVLFYRTPAGVHDLDYAQTSLWVMDADGSGARVLRPRGTDGWDLQGHAEWSPVGSRIVMFGGARNNPQIAETDTNGWLIRNLTNRPGTNLDPSYSPNGTEVAFTGCPQAVCNPVDYEIYVLSIADGTFRRMTDDRLRDHDPMFSPSGQTLAWLTQTDPVGILGAGAWDVRIGRADGVNDGAGPRLLFGDGEITSRPVWESESSLLVHRVVAGVDPDFQIYRVAADGSGAHRLTDNLRASEYPG